MATASTSTDASRQAAIDRSGWGHPVRFFQPHNPACYLYWLLVLKGAYLYYGMVSANAIYPTALFIAICSQVLYCLPWVWFLTGKDRYEREPAKLALLAFLWGGLVATWVMSVLGGRVPWALRRRALAGVQHRPARGPRPYLPSRFFICNHVRVLATSALVNPARRA